MTKSVFPEWLAELPLQQQTVIVLPLRGPDGLERFAPCKAVVRHYRASVLLSAKNGRILRDGEVANDFMTQFHPADHQMWSNRVRDYFHDIDRIPHHYHSHLMHGAEILGRKHPEEDVRSRWWWFYERCCDDKHVNPETEEQMNKRLNDWNQVHWEDQ